MKERDFDFGVGRVMYWDLDRVDASVPLLLQLDELKEDLVQVEFDGHAILDVGWYPEFQKGGWFVVVVVKKSDWGAACLQPRLC